MNFNQEKPIERCSELTEIIIGVKKRGEAKIHPATKTFQALRIRVNQELENVAKGLDSALEVLKKDGRAAVISFHALEDRVVKNKFRDFFSGSLFLLNQLDGTNNSAHNIGAVSGIKFINLFDNFIFIIIGHFYRI